MADPPEEDMNIEGEASMREEGVRIVGIMELRIMRSHLRRRIRKR